MGYRGNNETRCEVHMTRNKASLKTYSLRKYMKRHSAIEPIVGHMKSDGLLGRNYLKGSIGDKINALLCGADHDLRVILRKLQLFWFQIYWDLYTCFSNNLDEIDLVIQKSC